MNSTMYTNVHLVRNTMIAPMLQTERLRRIYKMSKVALLGDSIIDNKVYVGPGEFSVLEHIELLSDLEFSQIALDGDTTVEVLYNQLEKLEETSDFNVLSIGGNDLLEHLHLLVDPINKNTFSRNLEIMNEFIEPIKERYEKIVEYLSKKEGKLLLCTVYNGDFERDDGHETFEGDEGFIFGIGDLLKGKQEAATVIARVFNDVVYSTGKKFGVDVLELREIFTDSIDYANPIEPSHVGGAKLAENILKWIKSHD